jgi:hypothetical protein
MTHPTQPTACLLVPQGYRAEILPCIIAHVIPHETRKGQMDNTLYLKHKLNLLIVEIYHSLRPQGIRLNEKDIRRAYTIAATLPPETPITTPDEIREAMENPAHPLRDHEGMQLAHL